MATNPIDQSIIDRFRIEWMSGRIDYQRAAERVEDARRAWQRASDDSVERLRRAQDDVDHALQRLDEIRAVLDEQFDRFCGHMPRTTSLTRAGSTPRATAVTRAGSTSGVDMPRAIRVTRAASTFEVDMPHAIRVTTEGSTFEVVRAESSIEFWMDRLVGLTLVFVSLVVFYAMTLPSLMGPWYYVSILAFIAVLGSLVGMPLLVTGRVRRPR
jgi:hypothetical protein